MLRSKVGIKFIDNAAKRNINFWNAFADWGLTVSLGLIAYPLFRKTMDKKMFVLGMLTLLFIFFVVMPSLIIPLKFINIPQIQSILSLLSPSATTQLQISSLNIATAPLLILMLIGGVALLVPFVLFANAFSIILAAVSSIQLVNGHYNYSGTYNAINSQIPGVAPLIPGITIPLFAGILSLAIILVIHEFSHGILARISKIKIKNTGLIFLLGVIPIGAFVEPNEKEVSKLSAVEQNRISIAGVSANLLATIICLVLLALFLYYIVPAITINAVSIYGVEKGYPAYNVISTGSYLLSINNQSISSVANVTAIESSLPPYSILNVRTNMGDYNIRTNSHGKLGIYAYDTTMVRQNNLLYSFAYSIFVLIGLLFLLNFSIAAVNLLPIPGFDGWRIYGLEMKKRMNVLYFIEVAVLAAILINLLPLVTYLSSVL